MVPLNPEHVPYNECGISYDQYTSDDVYCADVEQYRYFKKLLFQFFRCKLYTVL